MGYTLSLKKHLYTLGLPWVLELSIGWLVGWFNSRCRRRLCLSMAPQLSIRIDFLAHVQLLMYTALDGGRLNRMVGVSNREKSRPCCILFGSIVYSPLGCSPLEEEKERSQLEEEGGWRRCMRRALHKAARN